MQLHLLGQMDLREPVAIQVAASGMQWKKWKHTPACRTTVKDIAATYNISQDQVKHKIHEYINSARNGKQANFMETAEIEWKDTPPKAKKKEPSEVCSFSGVQLLTR